MDPLLEFSSVFGSDNTPLSSDPSPLNRPKGIDKKHLVAIDHASKYGLIFQTLLFAAMLTSLKYVITLYSEFKGYMALGDVGLVFTGLFFIIGVVFGQVNADLKEAEKMPAEVACSAEQMIEQFRQLTSDSKRRKQAMGLMMRFLHVWHESLLNDETMISDTVAILSEIVEFSQVLDPKADKIAVSVDKVRRLIVRGSALTRTVILPSGQGLMQFFVLLTTIMLFLVKFPNEATQWLVMLCINTVTWFAIRMVSAFDDPFGGEVFLGMSFIFGSNRLVHMFPLHELALRFLDREGYGDMCRSARGPAELVAAVKSENWVAAAAHVFNSSH